MGPSRCSSKNTTILGCSRFPACRTIATPERLRVVNATGEARYFATPIPARLLRFGEVEGEEMQDEDLFGEDLQDRPRLTNMEHVNVPYFDRLSTRGSASRIRRNIASITALLTEP